MNVRHRIAFIVLLAFASPAFPGAAIAQSAPEAKERVREFLEGRGPKVKKA